MSLDGIFCETGRAAGSTMITGGGWSFVRLKYRLHAVDGAVARNGDGVRSIACVRRRVPYILTKWSASLSPDLTARAGAFSSCSIGAAKA
jgi:hypothetical protein